VVLGEGFQSLGTDGDAPAPLYGRRALCRFATGIVNATLESDGLLRCISPPSMGGRRTAALSVTINGKDFVGGEDFLFDPRVAAIGPRREGLLGRGAALDAATLAILEPRPTVALGAGEYVPGAPTLSFVYFEHPELLGLSPVGGPIDGLTVVALTVRAPLTVRDLMVLRCRFGDAETRVAATLEAHPSAIAQRAGNATGNGTGDGTDDLLLSAGKQAFIRAGEEENAREPVPHCVVQLRAVASRPASEQIEADPKAIWGKRSCRAWHCCTHWRWGLQANSTW
jgi:hypothetical protein